ncbi:PEP-CTERM sorting domain-containing protein [Viridibacterium curvum]|uniref:Ice-binding protein C-terminal domain-containing protein n=1 Tax=Viridibacterium curvum TaxID=1101404 RepID=A0ABP9QAH9_9RHOO
MIHMKKMAAAVALAAASIGGAHALVQGDIAFTGLSTNTTVGGWSFATFADIALGTTIYFTDTSIQTNGTFVTTPETFWSWTATSQVDAGTIITVTNNGSSTAQVASTGSVVNLGAGTGGAATAFNVSSSGDTLYAYLATSSTFNTVPSAANTLAAISNRATPYASSDDPASISGITLTNIRGVSTLSTEVTAVLSTATACTTAAACRWAEFNPTGTYASVADLKAAIANTTNWASAQESNSVGLDAATGLITPVPEASTYAMLLAGLGMIGLMARRRSV